MMNRIWLAPISALYSGVMQVRNWSFQKGILKAIQVDRPVISIGNITMGGTGKTPILSMILEWCRAEGIRPGVVTRGYRSQVKGVEKVDVDQRGADYFGDEPFWLARRHSEVPVYIGRDRVAACRELLKRESVQVIFSDDGFQHRRLFRDRDFVVIDATEALENYRVVPLGRAREAFENIRRADALLVTKTNLVAPNDLKHLLSRLEHFSKPIFQLKYTASEVLSLSGEHGPDLKNRKVVLVSAIGNPRSFEMIVRELGCEIVKHMILRDHHRYSEDDVAEILEMKAECGASALLTTEKDAVKLQGTSIVKHNDCSFVGLQLIPETSIEPLYELIRSALR